MLTTSRSEASWEATLHPPFAELRAREFGRLDAGGHTYLDYTGSALYPDRLVADHAAMLRGAVLGNPHSESPASLASTALIAEARARVLRFFDADPEEYVVCFTANTSGAIQLVGSGFAFGPDAPFILSADNHNSVNGVREHAARAGAPVHYLPLDAELRLHDVASRLEVLRQSHVGAGLVAFPAQSNFSGVQHPLALVRKARSLGYTVLLDAAAFAATSPLSLRAVPADFVACSFYKMFGYPTGIGALVARRAALSRLRRPWFSGGTVEYVSVQHGSHLLRDGAEGFEDGTPNFLAIGAVVQGLDFLDEAGLPSIKRHTQALARRLVGELRALTHHDGAPLVHVYGPEDHYDRGGTVAFNVLDRRGAAMPYAMVEESARERRISVRGGCFCNPGASESAFEFVADRAVRCLDETRRAGWSLAGFAERMRRCEGSRAVGAVRASFGVPSNASDVERLVELVQSLG
ncbi:MAG TPA: aminotransferase class V-fold PLP-dependent enzyme [Gemmatimonadaceae bacterium]|nr:aminotransferase class V-fold PLP-dependent enzyme [Gemmatimonadaceae bacterium]